MSTHSERWMFRCCFFTLSSAEFKSRFSGFSLESINCNITTSLSLGRKRRQHRSGETKNFQCTISTLRLYVLSLRSLVLIINYSFSERCRIDTSYIRKKRRLSSIFSSLISFFIIVFLCWRFYRENLHFRFFSSPSSSTSHSLHAANIVQRVQIYCFQLDESAEWANIESHRYGKSFSIFGMVFTADHDVSPSSTSSLHGASEAKQKKSWETRNKSSKESEAMENGRFDCSFWLSHSIESQLQERSKLLYIQQTRWVLISNVSFDCPAGGEKRRGEKEHLKTGLTGLWMEFGVLFVVFLIRFLFFFLCVLVSYLHSLRPSVVVSLIFFSYESRALLECPAAEMSPSQPLCMKLESFFLAFNTFFCVFRSFHWTLSQQKEER